MKHIIILARHFTPRRVLVVILALSVLARIGSALLMGDTVEVLPGIFDQVSYHTLALRLLGGHGFTFDQEWWPITPAGQPTAHWSYLYTGYLVLVYAVFGAHPLAARLIQAVLAGLLLPWLTYRLGRRLAPGSQAVGLIAAAWSALYGYFAYYGGALMTETFYILCILWMLDAALEVAAQENPPLRLWLLLGLACGLTALLRQVILPFVLVLFIWLAWVKVGRGRVGMGLRRALPGALAALVVMGALILPVTAWNYSQFGRFVLLNTNAGYAFFWSNHPVHGYAFVSLFTPDMPTYQELIPAELRGLDEAALNDALMQRGWQFVFADPLRYLALCVTRIPDYFMFWPSPQSSTLSNIVRVGSIGVALPFMLAGLMLWWRRAWRAGKWALLRTPGGLLLLFMLVYTGIHLASWAGIRYRLPVDAVGLLFAAIALHQLTQWGWQKFHPAA